MVRTVCHLCGLVAIVLSTQLDAQLSLSPNEINIHDSGKVAKVLVTYDGKPVLPGEIIKIASGVTKSVKAVSDNVAANTHFSDYSYMFEFEIDNGGIISLVPNQGLVEIGSYELVVKTVHGTARGLIIADLRDSIPPLPPRSTNLTKFNYDLKLPDYVYGQAVSIDLAPDQKNIYTWYIDGKKHSSGRGLTSFRAWPEPGDHEISYVAHSPGGEALSNWSDTTVVTEEAAISSTVRKGYKVPFSAPGGYTQVSWMIDGKLISENVVDRAVKDTQLVTFRSKGTHVLTCFARGSVSGDFRRITWTVDVK